MNDLSFTSVLYVTVFRGIKVSLRNFEVGLPITAGWVAWFVRPKTPARKGFEDEENLLRAKILVYLDF